MKKIALLILLIPSTLFSQTHVPAGAVQGTWTLANSPFSIEGNIEITNGDSLIIQPGVTVNFKGHFQLKVMGKLIAIGKTNDTITFTSENPVEGWGGIRFDNTPVTNDTSRILFCKIENGKVNAGNELSKGGGIYINTFSKIIISNTAIVKCSADNRGGGIYIGGSNLILRNNTIAGNSASFGGGIFVFWGSPLISNNTISNNKANSIGGAVFNEGTDPLIVNNTISDNKAPAGAGIYNYGSAKISYNLISNNKASSTGGGIYFNGNGAISISNNTIFSNTAGGSGAGIYCNSNNTAIIRNNLISNNIVTTDTSRYLGGGGIYCFSSAVNVNGNVIVNNNAPNGGGVACYKSASIFTNNTIANNGASIHGGGITSSADNPLFRNCIIWGNKAIADDAQVFIHDILGDPDFYYCNLKDSNAFGPAHHIYTGAFFKNINKDPRFVSPTIGTWSGYNGMTADWSLQNNSPCIDAGDPIQIYFMSDIAGNIRVQRIVDIGAYEYTEKSGVKSEFISPVSIYPNPSKGIFTIKSNVGEMSDIEIFNTSGKRIYVTTKLKEALYEEIDLSTFAAGMYFVKIYNGQNTYTGKVVIH